MLKSRLFIALALAIPMAALAAQQAVTLAWTPKEGFENKLKLSMKSVGAAGPMGEMSFNMVLSSKITKVEADKITSEESVSGFQLFMNGEEMTLPEEMGPPKTTTTLIRNRDGKMIEVKGVAAGQEMSARYQAMNEFSFPKGPVKPDDSWNREVKADKAKGLVEARAKYTYKGVEVFKNINCWKIEYAYSEIEGDKPMGAVGTIWLEQGTGEIVRIVSTLNDVTMSPMMPPMNMKSEIVRM